jgi:uncharacterized protein (TIGR03435 family)
MPGPRLPQRVRKIVEGGVSSRVSRLRVTSSVAACVAISLAFVAVTFTRAQSSGAFAWDKVTGSKASFDAASIKVNKSGPAPMYETLGRQGGYVTFTNFTLQGLIEKAYFKYNTGLSPGVKFLMTGDLPHWAESEHFDIEARANGNPNIAQKQLMLQSLLEDRFKLAIHYETRRLPVYALVVANSGKTGSQLLPHADNTCVDRFAQTQASAAGAAQLPDCGLFFINNERQHPNTFFPASDGTTMSWFAQNLTGLVDHLVVDHTGLNGKFDFKFGYTPEPGQPGSRGLADAGIPNSDAGPSIFTALQQQLGLKLQSETDPVEVLVIDHMEQPTAN